MAFYSTLVAIDWSFGQYRVSGQFNGGVDSGALQKSGRMINLGTDYYQDLVAIVSGMSSRKWLATQRRWLGSTICQVA